MTIDIRAATEDDIPEIVEMGARFYAESKWEDIIAAFDPVSFEITVRHMMVPESGGIVLVAQNGSGLAGMAAAAIFPCFFNLHVLQAQEVFIWCAPSARGHAGPRLMDGLETVAKGLGAKAMMGGKVDGLRDAAMTAFWTRRGYRAGETSFVKAL